jgi:hypothetical protein
VPGPGCDLSDQVSLGLYGRGGIWCELLMRWQRRHDRRTHGFFARVSAADELVATRAVAPATSPAATTARTGDLTCLDMSPPSSDTDHLAKAAIGCRPRLSRTPPDILDRKQINVISAISQSPQR